ncbi:MAG TPA: hypothetical protein VFG54_19850 [Prolixibacteraceae bacterium]|nr:hypothetical protein [Prolixibacteraceae bacterium]
MRNFLLAAMIVIVALACQDEQLVTEKAHSDLLIKTGTICGWCSLNDTLTIQGNSVRYVNYTQCNNTQPSVEKNGQISSEQLEALLSVLDFEEFKKLDLNSCNVCFDGCDDWISFNNGTESHYIRFTRNDPKLQPIMAFVDSLNAIKFNNQ